MKKVNSLKILTLLVFILVFNNDILFSQSSQPFYFGIVGGINYSKFYDNTIDLNYAAKPAIGFFAKQRFPNFFYLKSSILYSKRGSVSLSSGYLNMENKYLDFNLTPQLRICNGFYLQAGICFSVFLKSKNIILDGNKWNGISKIDNDGFNSEINLTTGIEIKLSRITSFEFNFTIPTPANNTKNFQFSLNFLLNSKTPKNESYRQKKRTKSKDQIKQLNDGTLLVMLNTSGNKVNALRKTGKNEKANSIELQQETENKFIIDAFNKYFTFCDVAFFYCENLKNIKNRKFSNVFLNDSLIIDNSISIDTSKPIFIAAFTSLEQDTMKYFSHYSHRYDSNGDFGKVENFHTPSSDINFKAIVIKDENFVQLNRPFPYYTRAMFISLEKHPEQALFLLPILPFQNWSYDETVEKMNKKLQKYFIQHNKN